MKTYRTSTSHSKKTHLLDTLWHILEKGELVLFSIFLKLEIRANSKNLRLKRVLENYLVQHVCLMDEKKQSPKKMNA